MTYSNKDALDKWVSVKEAAKVMNRSTDTIRRWAKCGKIPFKDKDTPPLTPVYMVKVRPVK